MKCILHVGPPKTGTTTIQSFLRQNREVLLDHGILALAHNEVPRKLPFFFKQGATLTPWARRQQLDQPERLEALRKETSSYIHNEITQHKPTTVVLSSEGLAGMNTADMTNMRDYLRGYASDIEILIYLRRPDFRTLSGYKNRLRNKGFTGNISTEYMEKYDDCKTIGRFGDCFGPAKVTPIICQDSHPCKAQADGHIEALLKILFRDADVALGEFIIPEPSNIAWDVKAMYYMREFNKIVESNPEFERYRQPIARLLQAHFSGGEKLGIKKSVAADIVANYRSGWEDITKQYFPNRDTLFHMDFSMYKEDTSSQTFGAEEAVFVSLVLIESLLKDNNTNEDSTPGSQRR